MADYTNSKGAPGAMDPVNAVDSSWGRLEPLLAPEQLVARFLVGIPLVSRIIDPITGQAQVITQDMVKDYIDQAVSEAEEETGLIFMPTQFSEKLPYQRQDFEQFGYLKLPHRPVSSVEELSVRLADNSDIFIFPTEWLETANLVQGQINLIPLAFQSIGAGGGIIGQGVTGGAGTAVFFNSLWNRPWVAALFNVTYTCGFKNGMMPKMVNELIGAIAAMRVLSLLAATYARVTSNSLNLDGMGQSMSTPGPQIFDVRIKALQDQRNMLVRKLKRKFGAGIVMGVV